MCGILGGNVKEWNYKKAINIMKHRGPDAQEIVELDNITLAFARLSIIDLSNNAMQPMFTANKEVGIVFNGEIYGYKKVREKLLKYGYKFRSSSDTEVILYAYLQWGDNFINKIDGMFAIAIYDGRIDKIKLFRDRIGIKPLYYYIKNEKFAFASELKGIENLCENEKFSIDKTAIFDYMNCLYIPEPKTIYRDVYKLEPANYLIYDIKHHKIEKKGIYWRLKINEFCGKQRNKEELQEELRDLIKESVEEQMIADVPVGTFLSGGVDSSIVTYQCNMLNKKTEAFTIGFGENSYNEYPYALEFAEKFAIPCNGKIFKKKDFASLYNNLVNWYDEPFADTSAFPTFMVSQFAKEKVTVALTGDGGDEVFGGYPRYKDLDEKWSGKGINNATCSKIFESIEPLSRYPKIKEFFLEELVLILSTYHHEISPDKERIRRQLGIDKNYDDVWFLRKHYNQDLPPITRGQYMDFKTYLPGDILTKVDRTSMAVSLETRVPLLSKKIVEFSFALSQEDRCPNKELKGLLKQSYINQIGRNILYRPKKGFSIPTRYIKSENSPQESLLKQIWKMPL